MGNSVTGGWSKYGGGRNNVIKAKITKTWYCQSCGREKPKEISPFLYELDAGNYIRICASCLHDGVIILQHKRYHIKTKGYDKNKPL